MGAGTEKNEPHGPSRGATQGAKMPDLRIGCHLSTADGYAAMADDAVSIGATTFAFFTRNPREIGRAHV